MVCSVLKDQVTGFRAGNGRTGGFQVAHFADENDVGVLTQGVLEAGGESRAVRADFTLFNHAGFVFQQIFDGVFQRNNTFVVFAVDRH